MKNYITKCVWIMVMFIVTLAVPAFAQGPHDGAGKNNEWRQREESRMQTLFKDLNLTDEQRKLLENNKAKNREIMESLRKSMEEYREQMKQLLQNEPLDMGKINQLQVQIKETQGKILDHRLEGILEVHKILTPDQFKKFSQEMQKERKQFRKRFERSDKGGKGPQDASE